MANCRFGREYVTVGSMTENRGNTSGQWKASFSLVDSRVMTAPQFISEPVAAIVSTEAKGTPQAARPLRTISHGSPS